MGTISSDAVKAKTGKGWDDWFTLLDAAGAAKWPHKETAAWLHTAHAVPAWWRQMITVEYERARGLRQVCEKVNGFSASISRTLAAPAERVYPFWVDTELRSQWLPANPKIRKATENRSLRITWPDGTNVDVMFYPKGDAKMQLTVEHARLADAAAVQTRKEFWSAALARLKELLR
ncbi:MAG TPA: DUF4287 domain-containing protein [Paludibaculum sp.]|jgi:hypothetical protein